MTRMTIPTMSASSIGLKVQRDGIIGGKQAQSELFSGLRTVSETPARVSQPAHELARVRCHLLEGWRRAAFWPGQKWRVGCRSFESIHSWSTTLAGRSSWDALLPGHAEPRNDAAANEWKKLIGAVVYADTWEVALRSGAGQREEWERRLHQQKLAALTFVPSFGNVRGP
jgi:hypothetical protein